MRFYSGISRGKAVFGRRLENDIKMDVRKRVCGLDLNSLMSGQLQAAVVETTRSATLVPK